MIRFMRSLNVERINKKEKKLIVNFGKYVNVNLVVHHRTDLFSHEKDAIY